MNSHMWRAGLIAATFSFGGLPQASAAEIKVLTTGVFKPVVLALVPEFEKQTGHKVTVDNGTAGQLKTRIEGGEAFDIVVVTPGVFDALIASGKAVSGSQVMVASVGVGVMVKEGTPKPDVSTVEKFKEALLAAKTVAYLDPASGGSSGIYVDKLLVKLGVADQIRPKAKLKNGGHVADLIVSGEAELGIHQISEIVAVKGAALVGPLPKEIQSTTTYAAGLSSSAKDNAASKALIKVFSDPVAAAVLKSKGLDPAS